jgi:hypothetical protein
MTKQGSILDYVREDIDQDLWQIDSGEIKLRPEIRTQILDIVGSALDDFAIPESALKGLYIYGSILTNQYNDKTDVDCRILLSKEAVEDVYPELTGDDIFDIIEDQVHGVLLGETQHPLNCSVIIEGEQEELGRTEHDPVYDVLADKLIKGPVLVDDTDPEDEFAAERDDVDLIMEYLDELLRDAKTKTIDYEVLKEAVGQVAEPQKLQEKLEKKLKGIQDDIEQLVVEYEVIKEDREEAFGNQTVENPHKQPGNVRSKYLERYQYLDTLKKLKKILKGGVSPEEIPDVEKALKLAHGENVTTHSKKPSKVDEDIYLEKLDFGVESPGLEIWRVDEGKVRNRLYTDFTIGGHDRVYSFIPDGQVWIGDDVDLDEIYEDTCHELWERFFMGEGVDYEEAHEMATELEQMARRHPEEVLEDIKHAIQLNVSKKKSSSLTASYEELNTWEEILARAVLDAVAEIEAEVGNKATDEQKLMIAEKTKEEFLSIEGDKIEELIADLNAPGSSYGGSVKDYIYDICYSKAKWLADELIE